MCWGIAPPTYPLFYTQPTFRAGFDEYATVWPHSCAQTTFWDVPAVASRTRSFRAVLVSLRKEREHLKEVMIKLPFQAGWDPRLSRASQSLLPTSSLATKSKPKQLVLIPHCPVAPCLMLEETRSRSILVSISADGARLH